jgi:hypothetical protein
MTNVPMSPKRLFGSNSRFAFFQMTKKCLQFDKTG